MRFDVDVPYSSVLQMSQACSLPRLSHTALNANTDEVSGLIFLSSPLPA